MCNDSIAGIIQQIQLRHSTNQVFTTTYQQAFALQGLTAVISPLPATVTAS
jgi:hypothetical protein